MNSPIENSTDPTDELAQIIDAALAIRTPRYWPAVCLACGWKGSSELLREEWYGEDGDVFCPKCESDRIEEDCTDGR